MIEKYFKWRFLVGIISRQKLQISVCPKTPPEGDTVSRKMPFLYL